MQTVQKICCSNTAGFVMNFWVEYLDVSIGQIEASGTPTANYPNGQQQTVDLDTLNIPNGAHVRPHVQAIQGTHNPANTWVQYGYGTGATATYLVSGTTNNFSVVLES